MKKVFLLQLNNKNLLTLGADNVLKVNQEIRNEPINTHQVADIFCNPAIFTPICYFSSSKDESDHEMVINAYRNCDTYANNLCYFHNKLFGDMDINVTKEFTYKPNWYLGYGDVFFVNDRIFLMSKNPNHMFVEMKGISERFKSNVLEHHFPDYEVPFFIDLKSSSFEKAAKHAKTVMLQDGLSPEEAIPLMGRRTKIAYMVDDLMNTFLSKDLDFKKACDCLSKYSDHDKKDVFAFFVYGNRGDLASPASRFISKVSRVDAVVTELNKEINRGMVNNQTLEDKINKFVNMTKSGLIGITKEEVLGSFKYRAKRKEVKIGRDRILDIGAGY